MSSASLEITVSEPTPGSLELVTRPNGDDHAIVESPAATAETAATTSHMPTASTPGTPAAAAQTEPTVSNDSTETTIPTPAASQTNSPATTSQAIPPPVVDVAGRSSGPSGAIVVNISEISHTTSEAPATPSRILPPSKLSIYRVPESIRKHNPEAYNPSVVSFGPFHHKVQKHLRPMEGHKRRVLKRIISLSDAGSNMSEDVLVVSIRQQLPMLLRCYAGFEGICEGEEEYVCMLMKRHSIHEFVRDIVKDGLPTENCKLEKLLLKLAEEFGNLLVKDADEDEFVRFTVRSDDVSHLMVRYGIQNLVRVVVDRHRPESLGINNDQELVCGMVSECVEQFVRRMVRDGLDEFARLMVVDCVFLFSLMVVANREVTDGNTFHNLAQRLQFSSNDPVFGRKAIEDLWRDFQRDARLLENQIPLRVFFLLVGVLFPSQHLQIGELQNHAVRFLVYPDKVNINCLFDLCDHMLDLFRRVKLTGRIIHTYGESAKTLFCKGAVIRSSDTDLFDDWADTKPSHLWRLVKHRIHHIPRLTLTAHVAVMLLNMLAFEHLHNGIDYSISCFMYRMAMLARKPLHLKILQVQYNIRFSKSWSKEKVCSFFQEALQSYPYVATKTTKQKGLTWPFTKNPLMWPITCHRSVRLLLIQDRARWLTYTALMFAFLSWLCTTLVTNLRTNKPRCYVSVLNSNSTLVP